MRHSTPSKRQNCRPALSARGSRPPCRDVAGAISRQGRNCSQNECTRWVTCFYGKFPGYHVLFLVCLHTHNTAKSRHSSMPVTEYVVLIYQSCTGTAAAWSWPVPSCLFTLVPMIMRMHHVRQRRQTDHAIKQVSIAEQSKMGHCTMQYLCNALSTGTKTARSTTQWRSFFGGHSLCDYN
jgi:hypothetical protein